MINFTNVESGIDAFAKMKVVQACSDGDKCNVFMSTGGPELEK